ncbi:MAG: hypothetical protein RI883_2468 [Bacteroidota bacterium]|jgi:hypothetical protein
MINAIIYLRQKHDPKELIKFLLRKKLIASASFDENNISYKLDGEEIIEETFSVITAQSKALLFNDIVDEVESFLEERVSINSTPIVGASGFFNDTVRTSTLKR